MTVSCFPLPLTGTILDAPAATEGMPSGTPEGGSWMEWDPGAGVAFGQLFGAVLETLSEAGTGTAPPVGRPPIPMRTETIPEPAESGDAEPEKSENPVTDPDPFVAVAVPVSGVPPAFAESPLDAQPKVEPFRLAPDATPENSVPDSWPFDAAHRVSLPDAAAGDRSSDLPPASSGTRELPPSSPACTEKYPDSGNADVRETAGVAPRPAALPPFSAGPLNVEPPVEWPPQKDRPPESPAPPIVTAPAVSFDSPPPAETGRTVAQRPVSRPMMTVRTAPVEEPPVAGAKPAFSIRIVEADRDATVDREAAPAPLEHSAGERSRRATQVDTPTLSPEDPIAIAAAPAARPGRPVQAETVRAEQPQAELDRTELPEVAVRMPETYRGTAARQISLRVAEGGEERVEVRVAEQSGELRVDVRARNEGLAGRLRDGLPELVGRLQENGLEAEVWRPSRIDASEAPARRDERPLADGQERNPGGQRGSGWQQGEEGGRRRHHQDGQSQGEVFDPYFQLRNENGQE